MPQLRYDFEGDAFSDDETARTTATSRRVRSAARVHELANFQLDVLLEEEGDVQQERADVKKYQLALD